MQAAIFSRCLLSDLVGRTENTAARFFGQNMLSELINFGWQFTLRETLRDQDTHNWVFPQSLADVFFFFCLAFFFLSSFQYCCKLWFPRERPPPVTHSEGRRATYACVLTPPLQASVSTHNWRAGVGYTVWTWSSQLFYFEAPSKINTYYKRCMSEREERSWEFFPCSSDW